MPRQGSWAVIGVMALAAAVAAQPHPVAGKPDDRLAQPLFTRLPWHRDLGSALAKARPDARWTLGLTTRTDVACPACDALEKGPLASAEFAAFAKTVELAVLAHARTADADSRPPALRDCPSLALFDPAGTVVARFDLADLRAGDFAAVYADAVAYADFAATLRSRPTRPSPQEAGELLVLEAELRQHDFVELDKRMQALRATLGKDQLARLEPRRTELEIDWLIAHPDMPATEKTARFLRIQRDRRVPKGARALRFWLACGESASVAQDSTAIDLAAEHLQSLADAPAAVIEALRKRAEALRRR